MSGPIEYVFEKGFYPYETIIESSFWTSEFEAIKHAKDIGADYVYSLPKDQNPHHVWCRGVGDRMGEQEMLATIISLQHEVASLNLINRRKKKVVDAAVKVKNLNEEIKKEPGLISPKIAFEWAVKELWKALDDLKELGEISNG